MMKPLEIRGARVRLGLLQKDVAEQLGIKVQSYSKKENGRTTFSDEEKVKLVKILGLSLQQFNDYLFDGALPY